MKLQWPFAECASVFIKMRIRDDVPFRKTFVAIVDQLPPWQCILLRLGSEGAVRRVRQILAQERMRWIDDNRYKGPIRTYMTDDYDLYIMKITTNLKTRNVNCSPVFDYITQVRQRHVLQLSETEVL